MNRIAIVGPDDVGKKVLAALIVGGESLEWKLETKYYTACINLVFLSSLEEIQARNQFQALILIIDGTKTSDLKEYQDLLKSITPELECSLVVSNQRRNTDVLFKISPEKAYELGVEVINVKHDPSLERSANILQSSDGIDRIIKALQCVMWPDMERRNPSVTTEK